MKCGECHEHDRGWQKPYKGEEHLKERGQKSLPQMVLICQPVDTRLKGDDRDALGTIKLTAKDLRRILIHGKHFPFLTSGEREKGGDGHWEMWETCDITTWGTTRDLGFPVTRDRDIVRSARDATEGRKGRPTSSSLRRSCASVDRCLVNGSRGKNPHSV